MDYREILTEKAAEQFRDEEASHAVIGIYKRAELIRTIEVELTQKVFCAAGKTVKAAAAMKERFIGHIVEGKLWYPFDFLYRESHQNLEKTLAIIAGVIEVDPTELKYMFIDEH